MRLEFTPSRMKEEVVLERRGDSLVINGEAFDFAPLPEGAELSAEAIESDWFTGVVRREGGVLHLSVRLPHGAHAPGETLFPAPVIMSQDGPVPTPPYDSNDNNEEAQNGQD